MTIDKFNIRVYAVIIEEGKVLLTDEFRLGVNMTKFPGGALEFGEGMLDCIKRELKEELDAETETITHFYTTDFFQQTKLLPLNFQLINVYYKVGLKKPVMFKTTEKPFDFPEIVDGAQCFRWIPLEKLTEDEVTWPIDKVVVKMIRNEI